MSCPNDKSTKIGLGVGLTFGLLFLILLVLFLLFFFVFKKGGREDPKLKKPNFQTLVFPNNLRKEYETSARENDLSLLKIELTKHLGLVTMITPFINSKDNIDTIPRALANIFQNEPLLVDLFENWVTLEVVASKSKGTLFRLNSCATNFYSQFIKLNCLHYLWWISATLVHEIKQKTGKDEGETNSKKESKNFEEEEIQMEYATSTNVQIHDTEIDELYVKANSYQLLLYLTQLERRIVNSDQVMPSDLRRYFIPFFHSNFDSNLFKN